MTRAQLDETWEHLYQELLWYAGKKLGALGAEAVNQAYVNIITNETYLRQPVRRVGIWIRWKVKREISRAWYTEDLQQKVKWASWEKRS